LSTLENISIEVSNSSGIISSAPRLLNNSTSATYRVLTIRWISSLTLLQALTIRFVASGSDIATTTTLAVLMPS